MQKECLSEAQLNKSQRQFSRWIVLPIIYFCLFGFKITIVGAAGSGVRIDDFFSLILIFLFFYELVNGNKIKIGRVLLWFLIFSLINFISTFYNAFIDRISLIEGLLFSLRHLEYLAFCYLGIKARNYRIQFDKILGRYLIYVTILIVLQTIGLVGGVTNYSFERGVGNAGGPWEMAAIASFMTLYFLFNSTKQEILKGKSLVAFFMLLITASRITTISTILVIFLYGRANLVSSGRYKLLLKLALVSVVITLITIILLGAVKFAVFDRVAQFVSAETFSRTVEFYDKAPIVNTQKQYFDLAYGQYLEEASSGDGDASALIRFSRWFLLLKATCSHWDSVLIGMGPSFASVAVDGFYVRVFTEAGALGLLAFAGFLFFCFGRFKKDPLMLSYLLVLFFTGFFIDIFVTYKAMFLFWFYYGYKFAKL